MKHSLRAFWILTNVECTRRRPLLLFAIILALAAWGTALYVLPSLRTGASSFDLLFLSTTLYAALHASAALGGDIRTGGADFLYSIGAKPSWLFTSKLACTLLMTCAFGVALFGVEFGRLIVFDSEPTAREWFEHNLTVLATNPREAFVLYALPALCVFLFLSSISNRTITALAAGIVASACILAFDRFAQWRGEAGAKQSLYAAAATILAIPATVLLTGLAVWVRQYEPNRSRPRVILLTSAIALFALRFIVIFHAGSPEPLDTARVAAVAVSPDGRKVAIEASHRWEPAPWLAAIGDIAGRSAGEIVEISPRVAIAEIDGPCEAKLVADAPVVMDLNRRDNPWTSPRHLRVLANDPDETEPPCESPKETYIYDSDQGRMHPAPRLELPNPTSGASRAWRRPDTVSDIEEIARPVPGTRIYMNAAGEIIYSNGKDANRRLWPAPLTWPKPRN